MQKFVLISFVFVLLFLNIPKQPLLSFDGEYTFYTKSLPKCDEQVEKNGSLYMVTCDSKNARQTKAGLKNIIGESVRFVGDELVFEQTAKSLGKRVFCYQIEDIIVIEGFCQSIDRYVTSQNKKINFQIAFDGTYITVGTPTIFGSF